MILLIECVILCIVFTLLTQPSVFKTPIKLIMSYPPKIRKRVENLPQYKDTIKADEKKHISLKIISVFVFAILLAIVAYFSGAITFLEVFKHVFILFFVVNVYDLLVLDVGIFCHSKKVRIPGTEDMDKEYRDPIHHIKGAVKGTFLGVIVALLSGGIIVLCSLLMK
jgi:hypothetical protein